VAVLQHRKARKKEVGEEKTACEFFASIEVVRGKGEKEGLSKVSEGRKYAVNRFAVREPSRAMETFKSRKGKR